MTTDVSYTAIAHPNIALIKYWGKADEALILPASTSFSMTLDIYPTTTTVTRMPDADQDELIFDGVPAELAGAARVTGVLDLLRSTVGTEDRVRIETANTVPTGAGLASSAAGFAALAGAAAAVFGASQDPADLSRLARRGSGSASRSVFGGFALWPTGDDETSVARPLDHGELEPALVVSVLDAGPKPISSRAAMRSTVETSPYFAGWLEATARDLDEMLAAFGERDLGAMGLVAERNAMRMHASMLGAAPPVRYLRSASVAVLDRVAELRGDGLEAWATMDAGPNVKVLCPRSQAEQIAARIAEVVPEAELLIAGPGPGLRVTPSGGAE